MIGDTVSVDSHLAMLRSFLHVLPAWERLGFDWCDQLQQVVNRLNVEEAKILRIFLDIALETTAAEEIDDPVNTTEWKQTQRIQLLEKQVDALKVALADACRRPMGVVPDSAEGLISQDDLEAAEERRPRHS